MLLSISAPLKIQRTYVADRPRVQRLKAIGESFPIVVTAGAAIAGLSAVLIATDPQKRREIAMQETGGSEKDTVRDYFDGDGFDRWKRIYGTTDNVNKVQLDIRDGHAITIDKVLQWLSATGDVKGMTVCDAGCGTGSLAIPLSLQGAIVSASDISKSMIEEAKVRFRSASSGKSEIAEPVFETNDLESIKGEFDTVTCLDVMIHYPQEKADEMISHLASLSKKNLIVSFAPKTTYYSLLKRIGELFPGPSKATRAYLHAEADVESALNKAGFKVIDRDMTATSFYFSRVLFAIRS